MSVHTSWAWAESREQRAEIVAEDKVQINNIGVRTQAVSGLREGQLSNKTWDTGVRAMVKAGSDTTQEVKLGKDLWPGSAYRLS